MSPRIGRWGTPPRSPTRPSSRSSVSAGRRSRGRKTEARRGACVRARAGAAAGARGSVRRRRVRDGRPVRTQRGRRPRRLRRRHPAVRARVAGRLPPDGAVPAHLARRRLGRGCDPHGDPRPRTLERALVPGGFADRDRGTIVRPPMADGSREGSASDLIDARIAELDDWRGATLAELRAIVKRADPEVIETWKWRGVPVWEHDGIICTGETYKQVVKMTFAKGAALKDPARLFNSSLEGNTRRAIDFHEGETIDEKALKALIGEAVALNVAARAGKKKKGG